MVKICPIMSRKESVQLCQANCALNVNGVCALRNSGSVSDQGAQMDQAHRLALLKQLVSRSR